MVQFPKAQLEELLAIQVGSELLETLIDSTEFIDKFGNKKDINGEKTNIKNIARIKFEEVVQTGLLRVDSITSSTGNILPKSLNEEVEKILKNTHGKVSDNRFLSDLFSTKQSGNYFELIKNNSKKIKDTLIDEIHHIVSEVTDQYKNLHITKIVLKEIRSYIPQVIKFYKKQYNISGADADWDGLLQKTIDQIISSGSSYNIINQKQEYLEFALHSIAEMAKIHVLVSILPKIQEGLLVPGAPIKSIKYELPNEKRIDGMINETQMILHGDGEEGSYTLKRRKNELNMILDRFSSCFKMVYAKDSKEEDIKEAYNNYISDQINKIEFNDLFASDNIWSYLNKQEDLYTDCITNSTTFIKEKKFFSGTTLHDILMNTRPNTVENKDLLSFFNQPVHNIKDNVPGMVKLKEGSFAFGHDPSAKLYVLSNDHLKYNVRFTDYHVSINNTNTVDLPSLSEALIFYQEYGFMGDDADPHFNPIKHLGFIQDVKDHVKRKLNEKFIKEKIPYLSGEQIKIYLE